MDVELLKSVIEKLSSSAVVIGVAVITIVQEIRYWISRFKK